MTSQHAAKAVTGALTQCPCVRPPRNVSPPDYARLLDRPTMAALEGLRNSEPVGHWFRSSARSTLTDASPFGGTKHDAPRQSAATWSLRPKPAAPLLTQLKNLVICSRVKR